MIPQFNIKTITDEDIKEKRILLRVDYNVSLTQQSEITDDTRITQTLPTIQALLQGNNKLILISHLGQPKSWESKFSLKPVVARLQQYIPEKEIVLVRDFFSEEGRQQLRDQTVDQILMLENIRFYPGEKTNDPVFSQQLATLADIYVNDAFGVCHRPDASVVGVAKILPSYAGLLLEKEISAISKIMHNPQKQVVAIIGGAKTSTKLPLLYKLTEIADWILLGGGIANTFLAASGMENLGKSLVETGQEDEVRKIYKHAKDHHTTIVVPEDFISATDLHAPSGNECSDKNIPFDQTIVDIGPATEGMYGNIIEQANTIIWNGPVGYIENPQFARGTEFIYHAVAQNDHAYSIVGGGDTLTAIPKREYTYPHKITHISTGGGAMLEFIEKGTLPGIEALRQPY